MKGWRYRFAAIGLVALLAALFGASARAAGPLSWGQPVSVDNHGAPARLTAASCPRIGLCVAVDDLGDVITSKKPAGPGSSWKLAPPTSAGSLTGVSCPSARFCVAVGLGGVALVSGHPTSGAWSLAHVGGNFGGVSCASASLCVAFQGDQLFASTRPAKGSSWRLVYTNPSQVAINAISCPSRSFCGAVDGAGDVITSTNPTGGGQAWRLAHVDGVTQCQFGTCGQASLLAITCRSGSLCIAADSAGNVFSSTRPAGGSTAWRAVHIDSPSQPPGSASPPGACKGLSGCAGFITSLSCPSARLCFAADPWGVVFFSRRPNGGASAWRAVQPKHSYQLVGISCPSAVLCVAVKPGAAAIISTRPAGRASAWHARRIKTRGAGSLTDISCPSASLCIAGDAGAVFASTQPAGGARAWTVQEPGFRPSAPPPCNYPVPGCGGLSTTLACASATLCIADTNFSGVPPYTPTPLTVQFLASRRPAGGRSTWKPTSGPPFGPLSCPTNSLCVGASRNQIFTSKAPAGRSSAWTVQYTDSAPEPPPPPCIEHCYFFPSNDHIRALSCPSATLCVATDGYGDVISSTDPAGGAGAWTTTQIVPGCSNGTCPYGLRGVSCASATFCVVASDAGILTSSNPASGPWSLTPVPGGTPGISPGSCPSRQLCIGIRGNDLVLSTKPAGGSWTTTYVDHRAFADPVQPEAVDCPSASFCVATDNHGDVIIGTEPRPS